MANLWQLTLAHCHIDSAEKRFC